MIGFSTGCFYKLPNINLNNNFFIKLHNIGASSIELSCLNHIEIDDLEIIDFNLISMFKFKSIHLPGLKYKFDNNIETKDFLTRIENIYSKLSIDNLVIHPDRVSDWKIFSKFNMPYSVENMDNLKDRGKSISEIKSLVDMYKFKIVFDINHSFSNDSSLESAKEFLATFDDNIIEFHISGYDNGHIPLYKSKQTRMLDLIKGYNIPIIIESVFENLEEAKKEFDYIYSFLGKSI